MVVAVHDAQPAQALAEQLESGCLRALIREHLAHRPGDVHPSRHTSTLAEELGCVAVGALQVGVAAAERESRIPHLRREDCRRR